MAVLPLEMGAKNRLLFPRITYRAAGNTNFRIGQIQRALRTSGEEDLSVDGLWGIQTAEAYKRLIAKAGPGSDTPERVWDLLLQAKQRTVEDKLPRVRIMYVSPEFRDNLRPVIRQHRFTYEMAGFDCAEEEIFDSDHFESMLADAKDAHRELVHLICNYRQSRSTGRVELDFGRKSDSSESTVVRMPTSGLRTRPLLILDGIHLEHPAERMQQFLLRNAFATVVAGEGAYATVLAPGMGEPPEIRIQALGRMADGGSLREVYAELIRAHTSRGPEIDYFMPPPALWTCDPDMSVLL